MAERDYTAMNSGHRQIDHTADLALEIWAASEAELLLEAARAAVAIMTENRALEPSGEINVEIEAVDREDRLVQWVNEIIYLGVTQGFLVASATLDLHATGLRASLRGETNAADHIAGELKSATYHDLALEERGDGWWARLVIDV